MSAAITALKIFTKYHARLALPLLIAGLLMLSGLSACDLNESIPEPTPAPTLTPAPAVISVGITIITPTPSVPTVTPTATPSPLPSSTSTATLTPTLIPTTTATPEPVILPQSPVATPTSIPATPTLPSVEAEPTAAMATPTISGIVFASRSPGNTIVAVDPANEVVFPPQTERMEFKWVWRDQAGNTYGCETLPSEDTGFAIHVWPDQPGYVPLGVADAADQKAITCEEKSGTRSYEVGHIRQAPGVAQVDGGRYRWEVALVFLDPYTVTQVSEPHVFTLPSLGPTVTPTPEPPRVSLPTDDYWGAITPIELLHDVTLPADAEKVEFRWRWNLASACELPPVGYGFEVRIWPEGPAAPMGAMGNAVEAQKSIICDPATGLFSYQVPNLKLTPALKTVKSGRFLWDIALVQFEPYTLPLRSNIRLFTLPEP